MKRSERIWLACLAAIVGAFVSTPILLADGDEAAAALTKQKEAQQAFATAMDESGKVQTGAEGLAIWEKFLGDYGTTSLAQAAVAQKDIWKARADANLARFGPGWMVQSEVAKRTAEADRLKGDAASAADPEAAAKLLDEAGKAHPYRADIPFEKFKVWLKAQKEPQAMAALAEVIKADPDNAAARNNIGVLSAKDKQWSPAIANLMKASVADQDVIFDNLDQALAMAEADRYTGTTSAVGQLRALVGQLQRAGKHQGQQRWGNSWVSQADYDSYMKDNQDVDRKQGVVKSHMRILEKKYREAQNRREQAQRKVDMYKNLSSSGSSPARQQAEKDLKAVDSDIKALQGEAEKLKAEQQNNESSRRTPPHAGQLVLLDVDGSTTLSTVEVSDGESKEGGGIFGNDDKPKEEPRKKPAGKTTNKNGQGKEKPKEGGGDLFN
ncbi:MAG: hypothetical protein BIFFINMI_01921 [Phycisphaerae bacterium]|nr:hypothetical protein [Phycisphaerae bacterium]